MLTELTPEQYETMRHCERLDAVTKSYESRWGIARLDKLVSAATAEKWQRQWGKISAAIMANDHVTLAGLVDGTVRGWAAIEAEALALGHTPEIKDVWHVVVDGARYVVAKNLDDARGAANGSDGALVLSVDELVRVYHDKYIGAFKARDVGGSDARILPKEFWKGGGDELPF